MKEKQFAESLSDASVFDDIAYKTHLILRTGKLLMQSGAHSSRATMEMLRAAEFMGIRSEWINLHVTYTTIMLNISDGERSYTKFRKCKKHMVDMTMVEEISRLADVAETLHMTLDQYKYELDRISHAKPTYNIFMATFFTGLACAALTRLFGGDWIAALLTLPCSALGYYTRVQCNKRRVNPYVGVAAGSFVSATLAYSTAFLGVSTTPWYPLVACVLYIVPGIAMLNAVDDMFSNYVTAGIARAVDTVLIVSSMTFGLLGVIQFGEAMQVTEIPISADEVYFLQAMLGGTAAAGFAVCFNVAPRLLPLTFFGGALAVVVRNICMVDFGMVQSAGSLVGATIVGLLAFQVAKYFKTSPDVISIPSVIALMPGVLMYRLLYTLVNLEDMTTEALLVAVQNGTQATLVIVAMTVGVSLPKLVSTKFVDRTDITEFIEEDVPEK